MQDKENASETILRDRMRDTLLYLEEHPDRNPGMPVLADRLSYSPVEFSWLWDIFFTASEETLWEQKLNFQKMEQRRLPYERETDESLIEEKYVRRDALRLLAVSVVNEEDDTDDILAQGMEYVENEAAHAMEQREEREYILFWWHDPQYKFHYLAGTETEDDEDESEKEKKELPEDVYEITMPAADYVVFTLKNKSGIRQSDKSLKMLLKYALTDWNGKKGKHYDGKKYYFISYEDGRYSVYFPLEETLTGNYEVKRKEKNRKIYGVDEWTKYIDEHIKENLDVEDLAKVFYYSPSHFRHVFQLYYAISVKDYIRKRKMQCAADEIRAGRDAKTVAVEYGFKTRAGFDRAFRKEFSFSPSQYEKGRFEVVDLKKYYSEFKGKMKISYLPIHEIKMIGHTVIPDRGMDVDIPAQISYWVDKDFPSVKKMRQQNNIELKEDKIAMWYHDADCINIEYILGPVVSDFKDVPDDMVQVTISKGDYAIFETNRLSDREDLAETIRMFSRCVFYGWVKEHRDKVDFNRFTFERYINEKAYIYIPVKDIKDMRLSHHL